MENKTTKTFTEKFLGLPLTGIALLGFAAVNTGILVSDKLIPIFDGTFMAHMLPGMEGGIVNGMMAVSGIAFAVMLVSYIFMALLGVNALRYANDPEGVRARTGLAKFLVVIALVTIASTATTFGNVTGLVDMLLLLFPSVAQLGFVVAYLVEVNSINKKTCAVCA